MSATIKQIQKALREGTPFVFGFQHIRSMKRFLNNRHSQPRFRQTQSALDEFLQTLQENGPHALEPDVEAAGRAMVAAWKDKQGYWRDTQETRRIGERERIICQSSPTFKLVGYADVGESSRLAQYLPVFRMTSSDTQWFEYINVPWQHHYMGSKTGIQIVG